MWKTTIFATREIKNARQKWIGLNRLTEPKLRLTLNFLIRGMEVYFECFYEYGFVNYS